MTETVVPPITLPCAVPPISNPFCPFGSAALPTVSSPTMFGSMVTPDASPASSIPFPRLPEKTLVRTVLLPPVEVISRPSWPFGAAPPKA